MAQAPATILQEINGLYVALYDRAADNTGINYWCAQLGVSPAAAATTTITTAQATLLGQEFVTTQSTYFTATYSALNDIQFVEALYGNIGGNAGDPTGIQYWLGQLQLAEAGGANAQTARAGIVGQFVDQMLSLDLTVGAAALGLSAAQYTAAQARQAELQNKITVSQFYANESALPGGTVLATTSTTAPAFQAAIDVIGGVTNNAATVTAAENAIVAAVAAGNLAPILALVTAPTQPNQTFTLTTGQDTFVGTGFNVFNAPLAANGTATLTSFDSLVSLPNPIPTGATPAPQNNFSVLNANFSGTPSPQQPGSVNIVGIPIWNIGQDLGNSTVMITGDAAGGPNIISGLMTLNFSDDETNGSLYIGDNSSPVYEPTGATANGFAINVYSAVGTGHNGVDVDIAASAFTGKDTINVIADVVGGFSQTNGSYNVPPEILVAGNDGDDYNPNWTGYLASEFSISAGASAGPNGPIGFQTWNINSIGALAVGTLNIIGLGGEGSSTATTINLTDDGSNTMLFANAISDSLSTDWKNVTTINLANTKGFVTITGLETNVQEVGITRGLTGGFTATAFATAFQTFGGGGLLASDTSALATIIGGAGNSFYDLSSLTPAAATKAAIDGGHGTAGNSEVAFNNAVMTSGLPITITHIQVLDDVSSIGLITVPINNVGGTALLENDGEAQGGVINMANFAGLAGLNTPYALLAENLSPDGGLGAPVPYGLPYTVAQFLFTPAASQAALLPPGLAIAPLGLTAVQQALDLQNGVVPAGFQLLQFLNADGSTQTVLGAALTVYSDATYFAVNGQDLGDGWITGTGATGVWHGFNMTLWDFYLAPNVSTVDTLDLFVSDDGAALFTGTITPAVGAPIVFTDTALYVPVFTVDNYTTVNIVMPWESLVIATTVVNGVGTVWDYVQDYVILGASLLTAGIGQASFVDQPVVTVTNASLNFFDNHADNGGSPPGGPANLVLGDTSFTDTVFFTPTALLPAAIGITSVAIDATTSSTAGIATTTINDFGVGSFEIGATNATNLNAQSTSHLIMDLPATLAYVATSPFGAPANGITVFGSLNGQNLLQGTSGTVMLDFNGHNPTFSTAGVDVATVYEDTNQALGAGWGNDTLNGGNGFGNAISNGVGGTTFTSYLASVSNATISEAVNTAPVTIFTSNGPGNLGDNMFTLGGTDTVNISATETGTLTAYQDIISSSGTVLVAASTAYANWSTVFVGLYDVGNSGGANAGLANLTGATGANHGGNTGLGTVADQAITDATINATTVVPVAGVITGVQTYVDGYGLGSDLVTINGFHFGGPLASGLGDTIVFGVSSWAGVAPTVVGATTYAVDGLVQSDGATANQTGNGHAATYVQEGTANTILTAVADVILDSIAPVYSNATALQAALLTQAVGNIILAGGGVAAHTEADIMVAFNTPTGVDIADVQLNNLNDAAAQTNTAAFTAANGAALTVHDLVHITSALGLANLTAHNIYFLS